MSGSRLIIILGRSASGKTTLARRLCADLALACLGKDEVKEALFDVLGSGDPAWSRRLSDASFEVLMRLAAVQLEARRDCLVEGNWRTAHAPAWSAILARSGAEVLQIACVAERRVRIERFAARRRHAGHRDEEGPPERHEPAGMDETEPGFLALPGRRIVHRSGADADADAAGDAGVRAEVAAWLAGL